MKTTDIEPFLAYMKIHHYDASELGYQMGLSRSAVPTWIREGKAPKWAHNLICLMLQSSKKSQENKFKYYLVKIEAKDESAFIAIADVLTHTTSELTI